MNKPDDGAVSLPPAAGVPEGWYPDPSGAPSWRRWEGARWGDAMMPYGPKPPDAQLVVREQTTWQLLRGVAPWTIAAQALGVAALASETSTYGALRRWIRAAWRADLHHQALPALPNGSVGSSSTIITITHLVVLAATVMGVVGWLRFSAASMRVAIAAGYHQRHHPVATGLLFFIPVAGPLVALAASRASLPTGHEARGPLGAGWALIAAGELAWVALYATVLATPSATAAWVVAASGVLAWVAAALVLPTSLEAIAQDHATLNVQMAPAYS